nr:uncharacterized protein LOC109182758 [Ipomoea batatas]
MSSPLWEKSINHIESEVRPVLEPVGIDGQTALHVASFQGHRDVVELMLDNGVEASYIVMKDSSEKKSNEGNGERGRSKEQQQVVGQHLDGTMSQQSLDAMDSLKRGLGPMGTLQSSPASTSSSYEFSGSQKNKTSLQELRASPVESVSSSPLRIPTSYKFLSTMSHDFFM